MIKTIVALASVMAAVRDEYRAGRMPGRLAVFWRQLTVEVPRFAMGVLPHDLCCLK